MQYQPPFTTHRARDYRSGAFPFSTRDIGEALPDYFRGRVGGKVEHPVAEAMLDSSMSLMRVARHYVQADMSEPDHSVLNRALGASDFGHDLVTSVFATATHAFNEVASGWRRILAPLRLPDFKPARIGSLSLSDFDVVPEHGEYQAFNLAAGTILDEDSIDTKGRSLVISRHVFVNDDAGSIVTMSRAIGVQAALAVESEVASKLSDTGNLDDGAPLFSATTGIENLYNASGAAPSVTEFDTANTKLWRQPTPAGSIAGLSARYLVCPPELYGLSNVLANSLFAMPAGSIDRPLDVICLPHLSSATEWYLLASPDVAPVLGLATLGDSPLLVERAKLPPNRDGIGIKARIDFRVLRMSRVGAVKVY